MEQFILIGHLLVALTIIGLIMLQQGKGADMGASFGAGGSQTLFGSDGSGNVLTRATSWLVVVFFATSFGLALLANQKSSTVDDLGLEIPPSAVEAEMRAIEQVEQEFPMIEPEVPVATDAPEEDVPALD